MENIGNIENIGVEGFENFKQWLIHGLKWLIHRLQWSNLTISHLQNSQNYRTINTRFQLISTHQNFNTQDHHFRY